jgi:hypothetical protein
MKQRPPTDKPLCPHCLRSGCPWLSDWCAGVGTPDKEVCPLHDAPTPPLTRHRLLERLNVPEDPTPDLLAYMDDRLDKLVRYPGGWGDPFAVENQYLMVVEFRWFVETGLRWVQPTRLWSQLLHDHEYLSNVPLAHQEGLREDQDRAFEELVKLLPLLRGYVPRECSDCDGVGYQEWLTGCPACGTTPPCDEPERGECPGPDSEARCKSCRSKGYNFEVRE